VGENGALRRFARFAGKLPGRDGSNRAAIFALWVHFFKCWRNVTAPNPHYFE